MPSDLDPDNINPPFAMVRNKDTRVNYIGWYREVFGFSNQIATALYDEQFFKDKQTISEFSDSEIDNVCRSLRRASGLPMAMTRLKLLTFWIRHQDRTSREVSATAKPLVRTTLETLNLLKEQKRLKDGWAANNKEPEYTTITLDLPLPSRHLKR
jgi:hypothetical protein